MGQFINKLCWKVKHKEWYNLVLELASEKD